ncbi:MAG: hypothetical protein IT306_24750 [Chloroflexi bacterium]|nr:hypothetical protein [Chloroflexota bacterium]
MARTALFARNTPGGVFTVDDLYEHPGEILFVSSATGTDSAGSGKSPDAPCATIDYAVGLCTASAGDVIYVMPGHAETIVAAAGIDADVAGISIIGLGKGSLKPTLTMGTATTATVKMNAANVSIRNIRFVNNIDSLVKFIDVNADYATIEDCDFVTSSTKEALSFINLATTKDYLTVRRCRFEQPTDPAGSDGGADTGALYCVDSEYILFEDCWFSGNFETAIFHNKTTACKHLWVKNCHGIQALAGAEPFQLVAGATGAMLGGGFITPAEAAATEATLVGTVGDAFFVLQPGAFGNDGGAGGQGGIVIATAS